MKTLLLFFLGLTALARGGLTAGGDLVWRADYEAALAEAKEIGKPLLLDFSATWCGPCRMMEATTFADPSTQRLLGNYITVRADFDKATALVGKFKVQAVPTLILLNRFGETVATSTGYLDSEHLAAFLSAHEKEARVTVSRADQARAKTSALETALRSPDPDLRESGLSKTLDAYAAREDDSLTAEALLKAQTNEHPGEVLTHLNDARLAVRILLVNLLSQKLGHDFTCDPWGTPQSRTTTIEAWQKKLGPQKKY